MKTRHTLVAVADFLRTHEAADPASVQPLVEGHISQAFRFQANGSDFVCRLAEQERDFQADRFAYDHFSTLVPIPKIKTIGRFDNATYYCISQFAEGRTLNVLSDEEMRVALPTVQETLGHIYTADISFSTGYGNVDITTGNAMFGTWQEKIAEIQTGAWYDFKQNAADIGLDDTLVDTFMEQIKKNLPYASETRRLLHGDASFDNMLIQDNHITAAIDWAHIAYGDWMSDFARMDFWWPNRHGDAQAFADKYDLEVDHLKERKALYWATDALWAIEFAATAKSEGTVQWLRENVGRRLI